MSLLTRGACKLTATLLLTLVPASLLAQSAELFLQSLDAPSGVYEQGDSLTIQSTTNNIGDITSGPYSITFYLSDDFFVSEDDIPIGSQDRAGLASATVDQTPVIVTIPADMTPGQYFINGMVDFADDFPQNNENFDATPIEVVASSEGAFVINTAISDAWFDPLTDGQGFLITVWEGIKFMFLAWFTFDTERPLEDVLANLGGAGQRWLTASGPYDGDTATLNIYLSTGGVFNMGEPPVETDAEPIGTITIVWTDCNSGILTYNIPSLGLMGEIPIQRIVLDKVPACEMAQLE